MPERVILAAAAVLLAVNVRAADSLFLRADANADGQRNLTDAVTTLHFLFAGKADAVPCQDAADADDNGAVDVSDAVYSLNHLFRGGPQPPEPFGECGADPAGDGLGCASFGACPQRDTGVREAWVSRYGGVQKGDGLTQGGLALDDAGGVYVAGSSYSPESGYDYVTRKLDPDARQLWEARYNGPGNGRDESLAIASDGAGGIYVSGVSFGGGQLLEDIATVKYDASGTEVWVARFTGAGLASSELFRAGLAVDAAGSVYLAASSSAAWVVKYSRDGEELWVTSDGVPREVRDLVADRAGNCWVTGNSDDIPYGYRTVKYDPESRMLWAQTYRSDGWDQSQVQAIGLDAAGNVCVTGRSFQRVEPTGAGFATVKYGPAGEELWVARHDPGNQAGNTGTAIGFDVAGNVYVTGHIAPLATEPDHYTTFQYGPDGKERWLARYSGGEGFGDFAYALGVDGSGSVIVTGASAPPGGIHAKEDYATVKYAPDGRELWVARYDGPGGGLDRPYAIALDEAGAVYVLGSSQNEEGAFDYALIKYIPVKG
ncbi:MAG: hypothetical protein HY721_02890 [Planctomycetes bacterium]|nr:hypothetical protein [Planctomycetota bacterium]